MKILFINQYYWPDCAPTAQILTDLCENLAGRGHDVHVVCSRGRYDMLSNHRASMPRYERRAKVHIHRFGATSYGRQSIASQMLDFLSFHLLVGLHLLMHASAYGLIVSLTTPP